MSSSAPPYCLSFKLSFLVFFCVLGHTVVGYLIRVLSLWFEWMSWVSLSWVWL